MLTSSQFIDFLTTINLATPRTTQSDSQLIVYIRSSQSHHISQQMTTMTTTLQKQHSDLRPPSQNLILLPCSSHGMIRCNPFIFPLNEIHVYVQIVQSYDFLLFHWPSFTGNFAKAIKEIFILP